MIKPLRECLNNEVKDRIWIISDLQQSNLDNARMCLFNAINDLADQHIQCDQIWYLGDATESSNYQLLDDMTKMQQELLGALGIPLRYALGNHDFDLISSAKELRSEKPLPFYNMVNSMAGWRSTSSLTDYFYQDQVGDYSVLFLCDHASMVDVWYTTHGRIHGNVDAYPYDQLHYDRLRERIANCGRPVITVSHYAYFGGIRPAELQSRLLPLPENVVAHFYGHAHIGDIHWAGERRFHKISYIDNHKITQFNVSALENRRGDATRSVILELYRDNSFGVFFRNHSTKIWEECYFSGPSTAL